LERDGRLVACHYEIDFPAEEMTGELTDE